MYIVRNVAYIIFLFIMAVQDIKNKSVTLKSIMMMTGLLFILNIVGIDNGKPVLLCNSEVFNIKNIAGSVIITALLLLYSLCTGCLGSGDVIIIGISCIFMGWFYTIKVFIVALLVMFSMVIIKLIIGRISLKQQIAFVPFLFIGQLGVVLFA